jgi:hypothetical protein
MAGTDFVSEKVCQARHRASKLLLMAILGLTGLFLAVSTAAWSASNTVADETHALGIKLESHLAAQQQSEQALGRQLAEMQRSLEGNRALLLKLLQERP